MMCHYLIWEVGEEERERGIRVGENKQGLATKKLISRKMQNFTYLGQDEYIFYVQQKSKKKKKKTHSPSRSVTTAVSSLDWMPEIP